MDCQRIIFTLFPDNEKNREILTAYLLQIGFESFDETLENFSGYSTEKEINKNKIDSVLTGLSFRVNYYSEKIPEKNWNRKWEENDYCPVWIGDECVIRDPSRVITSKAKYEILIHPDKAFGSGDHETTVMMIRQLMNLDLCNKKVLDVGCGTGILGIMASKLCSSEVYSVDLDSWAVESTIKNCGLNGVKNLKVMKGTIDVLDFQTFDIILANIHRNIILQEMDIYNRFLSSGGLLIVSGFFKEDMKEIKNKAASFSMTTEKVLEKNNWVSCCFQKP